jgi:hypothetical protein
MFNKDLENKIDELQIDVKKILETLDKLIPAEGSASESPFLTREGLFNYKHRKPVPSEADE